MSRYRYSKLDPGKPELRLVYLLPGSKDDDLCISIVQVPFSTRNPPKYEDLSYTWGSTEDPQTLSVRRLVQSSNALTKLWRKGDRTEVRDGTITLRGKQRQFTEDDDAEFLSVTQNLAVALQHLRQEEHVRVLWIDAICIDQQNLQERSTEVQRMGDIYRSASQVFVWLGPVSSDSNLGMETLLLLSQQMGTSGSASYRTYGKETSPALNGDSREKLLERKAAVSALLQRPWFTRLWIWQELLLGTQVVVACGSLRMQYRQFHNAVQMILGMLPGGRSMVGCLDTRTTSALERLVTRPRVSPILTWLIDATKHALCKDPRDRIYAILSLSEVKLQAAIKPDYTKGTEDVYKEASLWSIESYQSLEILTHCEMPYPPEWNCSWVPNLSTPKVAQSISCGNASGSARPEYEVTADNKLLVKGVRIGSVSRVSKPVPESATIKELLWIVREWVYEYLHENSPKVDPEKSRSFVSTLITRHYMIDKVEESRNIANGEDNGSFTTFMFTDIDKTSEEELLRLRFVQSV